MAEITLNVNGRLERIERLGEFLPDNIRKGLTKAGIIVEGRMVKNLSGPSHTRFPGNGNPYPGVLTGRLRGSVHSKLRSGGYSVVIGPNVKYAAIHEYGGRAGRGGTAVIPARPYAVPALEASMSSVVDAIREELLK